MKKINLHLKTFRLTIVTCIITLLMAGMNGSIAQDNTGAKPAVTQKKKAIKNSFEGLYILDNQTVMVPIKGTFEMDIQHRFGIVSNGYKDLYGLTGGSNIRIGFGYAPIENLMVGFGLTTERKQWDVNAKYAFFHQSKTKDGWPVSISYFANAVMDSRSKDNFVNFGDRFSFFNQLIVARKVTDKLSLQVAPSLSHFNNVEGYVNSKGEIKNKMKNDHFAIAFSGRYRITTKTEVLVNYDQPLTHHLTDNPHPNISFGLEMTTSSHTFQVYAGNYKGILPQSNNFYNQNDYTKGQFLVGFNITRLWNF